MGLLHNKNYHNNEILFLSTATNFYIRQHKDRALYQLWFQSTYELYCIKHHMTRASWQAGEMIHIDNEYYNTKYIPWL